jgi:hypothetical protein
MHAKKVETRSWSTSFSGVLAIHAAKGLGPVGGKRGLRELCATEPFYSVIQAHADGQAWADVKDPIERPPMPLGAIVATARLARCIPTTGNTIWLPKPGTNEHAFGNYHRGRLMWMLEEVEPLRVPVRCGSALGLWRVPAEVEAQVVEQLSAERRTRLENEARFHLRG